MPARRGYWRFDRESLLAILYEHGAVAFALYCELISNAVWAPTEREVLGAKLHLKRGDVSFTIRDLAKRVQCSPSAVFRWIARWKKAGLLAERQAEQRPEHSSEPHARNTKAEHRVSVLTITDYERYAFGDGSPETPTRNTAREHQSGTPGGTARGTYEESLEAKSEKKAPRSARAQFLETDNQMKAARYLFSKIRGNNPKAKEPNWQSWARDFDLIFRVDKRDREEVRRLIDFSQSDPFWLTNVLSPSSFRKHFDALTLKAKAAPGRGPSSRATPGEIIAAPSPNEN